tara:strand:+ start:1155 stop:2876 length:1722 start_codon:yes stop_codon:yes gene_type:complete
MEKIIKLRNVLSKMHLDGYLVPKNDEFFSEYIDESKDRLKFISNFSGSYGIALILKSKNYLLVDGRYTLQANNESGKQFKVLNIIKLSPKKIFKGGGLKIGFDPKLFTNKMFKTLFLKMENDFIPINKNLIDKIWTQKKRISKNSKFYFLSQNSVGEASNQKINKVIKNLTNSKADFQFITSSENSAWLLNIRGKDSKYSPIPHSYTLIDKNKNIYFFCDLKKINSNFRKKLKNIKFFRTENTELFLSKIKNKKFIIDKNTCSIFFENLIRKNNQILEKSDIIYFLKSIKSEREIQNTKKAHIFDGAALTKYLFWLKKNYIKKKITEISGEKKLLNFRKENKNFKFLSFPTISGVGANGAIIHYKASRKTNRRLKQGEIYLVDSGGQYNFGTTDVTRTISLGNNNKRIKNIFTRVLKGHIAVANYKLGKKTVGSKIDIVARKYLKQIGLDYEHGTGHGVGYFLNVHEGPQAISKGNNIYFEEGMIVSNEPGYYERNKFGIRIENLIYVKKIKRKIFFDNLTLVPIDKNLIDIKLLKKKEIKWLNFYHKKVFNNLKNFMNKNELVELRKACSSI